METFGASVALAADHTVLAGDPGYDQPESRSGVVFAVALTPNVVSTPETAGAVVSAPGVRLLPNRPNPFNPTTRIPFEISGDVDVVRLEVFDVAGRRVRTLIDGQRLALGAHTASWDGRDDAGRQIASGVYFYAIDAGHTQVRRSMTLLR